MQLGIYQHYKGNQYEVLGVATHSEDESRLVVYRPLYGDAASEQNNLWVRPYTMFCEDVIVAGKNVPRFAYIGAQRAL